jgi:hypothetical protein
VHSQAVPLGYGIDFGTSNSAISVAYTDRVEVLTLGAARSSLTLPSFVYLHRSGRKAAGDEGVKTFLKSGHEKTDCWKCPLAPYGWDMDCRQYRKGGGCNDARLLSGVKHELAISPPSALTWRTRLQKTASSGATHSPPLRTGWASAHSSSGARHEHARARCSGLAPGQRQRADHHRYRLLPRPVEEHDHTEQERGAEHLDRVQRLVETPRRRR